MSNFFDTFAKEAISQEAEALKSFLGFANLDPLGESVAIEFLLKCEKRIVMLEQTTRTDLLEAEKQNYAEQRKILEVSFSNFNEVYVNTKVEHNHAEECCRDQGLKYWILPEFYPDGTHA
jgi:hypothetical protein